MPCVTVSGLHGELQVLSKHMCLESAYRQKQQGLESQHIARYVKPGRCSCRIYFWIRILTNSTTFPHALMLNVLNHLISV